MIEVNGGEATTKKLHAKKKHRTIIVRCFIFYSVRFQSLSNFLPVDFNEVLCYPKPNEKENTRDTSNLIIHHDKRSLFFTANLILSKLINSADYFSPDIHLFFLQHKFSNIPALLDSYNPSQFFLQLLLVLYL